jgi:hypothetical protein
MPLSPLDYKALVRDDRIHASLYTDPRIVEDEMERIFYRGWVFVGHDSEIPHPGDFVTRTIGTQPVIMTRDQDGASPCWSTAARIGARWSARLLAVTRARLRVPITAGRMT